MIERSIWHNSIVTNRQEDGNEEQWIWISISEESVS